jgi:hypothetical protein
MVSINGRPRRVPRKPGSYLTLERTLYGPLVLAGELGTEGLDPKTQYAELQGVLRNITPPPAPTFVAEIDSPDVWIKPVEGEALTFRTVGAGRPRDVTLVPYHRLFGQRYAIYWRIQTKE